MTSLFCLAENIDLMTGSSTAYGLDSMTFPNDSNPFFIETFLEFLHAH
jgi:hypothetical protein